MKLWLKVSLCAVVMVTLSTTACSLLLLLRSGQSNLNLAIDNALANQQIRAASWQSAMQTQIDESYGETAARSLAKYLMGQLGDSSTALLCGTDVIYNTTTVSPEEYLPVTAEAQQYIIEDIDNKTMLIAGSAATVNETR